ncbi:hypothetical protein BCR39DRAFT_212975 [Naematelia encephala]|uniref:DUF4604 domain-containing protein n=1 Tax=Naematelia encephala TaxID=71784 RepID=A0A1Y2AZL1_9TREE|nr:hypothetical protein BCR39DRAFT_212975 [Naematelia encephala]
MPKNPTKNDLKGLTYIAQKPKFLQNFGQAPTSPPPSRSRSHGREREPDGLPSRPKEGKWAGGSDDEGGGKGRESDDDEWGETFGGGGDDGPQVVVLKEGRHLTADEVKRERRRGELLWL